MGQPYVSIDLDKIEHNAQLVVTLCKAHGLTVVGVTKGVGGHPEVAKAMLRGGVTTIGESQLANIRRLKSAGVNASFLLLRLPALSEVDEVVEYADVSLNSELVVLEGLSGSALRRGRTHDVVIMVELGDLREGVCPRDLMAFVHEALRLPGIRIVGVGTNLACLGGVMPSEDNMRQLVALAEAIEQTFVCTLRWISGVNSSGLNLMTTGHMPQRVNHARIGEAILLGRETTQRQPLPGAFQDAFLLHAEVLEIKQKLSMPIGMRGEDAFGHLPTFENHGEMTRALLNIGREEVAIEGLAPQDSRLAILGASSSYLLVDATAAGETLQVGDELTFSLNYGALLSLLTSEYVDQRAMSGGILLDSPLKER